MCSYFWKYLRRFIVQIGEMQCQMLKLEEIHLKVDVWDKQVTYCCFYLTYCEI